MKRRRLLSVVLFLAAAIPATLLAAPALELPPPHLAPLVPLAVPALDKPPVTVPGLGLPAPPRGFPDLPPARLVTGTRPVAPLPPPRMLACNPLGSVFGVGTELVECGRARFQRSEFEDAQSAFQSAVQRSSDRLVVREGRYWLAETLLRLNRREHVEHHLTLVAQDDPRGELGTYATHTLGWLILEQNQPARALPVFEQLLRSGIPADLVPYARHGRALSLYALRRYEEAREAWAGVLNQSLPRPLATEMTFWLGETLGRLKDYPAAVSRLQIFTASGPQILIEPGLLRLGWWSRAASQPLEAVKAYRGLLSAYPRTTEALWARAGLVQALLDLDDFPGARDEARKLDAQDGKGTVALPALLVLARSAVEKNRMEEARALHEELLARSLDQTARAYVLLLSGEALRQAGQGAEARSRFELVRGAASGTPVAWQAALRLAQMDLEAREFAQGRTSAEGILRESLSPELRAAALVVAGESNYWTRAYERAAGFYTRFLSDFPGHPQASQVAFALGWAEFRRGRLDVARQHWTRFAQEFPSDARVPPALLLAAELAAKAGDTGAARTLLDQIVTRFPDDEHAELAILNRSVLSIRAGQARNALTDLNELVQRGRLSPFAGRIRLARGIALMGAGRSAEAPGDFRTALTQGEDALARLGLASTALERRQWDEATREFTEARNAGSAPVAAAAEYGLAAVAFNQGKKEDFTRLGGPLLSRPKDSSTTPHVLHAMSAIATDEKKWSEARTLTLRLVTDFPGHDAAGASLARLGAGASQDAQWPIVREAYQLLADRFPQNPGNQEGRLDFGEALLRTGAAPDARRRLQTFIDSSPGDPRMPRALLLLAQAAEASGDRPAAVEIYARLGREHPNTQGAPSAMLGQARLLQGEGKWDQARPLLEKALANPDAAVSSEAGFRMGEGFRAAGQHEEAVEAYMSAAYAAPDSSWGRRALLGAAQSFAALKQTDSAVIAYRKLLAKSGLEPDLAEAARKGLRALGAN